MAINFESLPEPNEIGPRSRLGLHQEHNEDNLINQGCHHVRMRKELAIAGGIVGAIFTGASVWAFTEVHTETIYPYGFPVEQQVNGYPVLGAVFIVFAIVSFVIMAVGFLSEAKGPGSPKPISQNQLYACPYCGEPLTQGTPVCPKCKREIKW
jgi:hypothetical protein